MKRIGVVLLLVSVLTACGGDETSSKDADAGSKSTSQSPSPSESPEETPSETPSETPTPSPTSDPNDTSVWNLGKGYPKVVPVSTLPDQVRNWYEMSDIKKALAVAPGVWAEMPPGATVEDAMYAAVFDGFCASKKAFERKYLDGMETGGTCW